MLTRIFAAASLAIAVGLSVTPTASAGKAPVYTGKFSNLALQGHDPVAYFTDGAPTRGKKEFSTDYNGAEFWFASQFNLDIFLADPAKYAPQYGGYCAWAIADGKFAKGDANHWAIVDGKLYLNYNKSVQNKWNADRSGFIKKADALWPDVLGD